MASDRNIRIEDQPVMGGENWLEVSHVRELDLNQVLNTVNQHRQHVRQEVLKLTDSITALQDRLKGEAEGRSKADAEILGEVQNVLNAVNSGMESMTEAAGAQSGFVALEFKLAQQARIIQDGLEKQGLAMRSEFAGIGKAVADLDEAASRILNKLSIDLAHELADVFGEFQELKSRLNALGHEDLLYSLGKLRDGQELAKAAAAETTAKLYSRIADVEVTVAQQLEEERAVRETLERDRHQRLSTELAQATTSLGNTVLMAKTDLEDMVRAAIQETNLCAAKVENVLHVVAIYRNGIEARLEDAKQALNASLEAQGDQIRLELRRELEARKVATSHLTDLVSDVLSILEAQELRRVREKQEAEDRLFFNRIKRTWSKLWQ